ncbi:MAG: hypothetical protein RLZ35_1012 [Pseudomonadota bacterium]|jgi:hypothetical protein
MKTNATVYTIPTPNTQAEPIVLESSTSITLRCGEATLRLLPTGELQLNGQTVKIEANQTMTLNATQVRVNCEE